jgi:hypothetical protein
MRNNDDKPFNEVPAGPGHTEDCVALQGVPMCSCGATLATALMITMFGKKLAPAKAICTEN